MSPWTLEKCDCQKESANESIIKMSITCNGSNLNYLPDLSLLCAGRMLALSRAVVCGVARAPAAVSQGGVTAITRFNSTAQVTVLSFFSFCKNINLKIWLRC